MEEDDLLIIEDDDEARPDSHVDTGPDVIQDTHVNTRPDAGSATFKVLIVDDDEDVHSITRYSLKDSLFLGSSLELISAYSAAEARAVLEQEQEIALIFLDVVMETDDAGLQLARYIRHDLNNWLIRIVLRTGQPGQAPERKVISDYDINDYKAKTELTATGLYTTTLVSLRTYRQLRAVDMSRRGLKKILDASSSLFQFRSMTEFAQGVVLQIRSFIEGQGHGVLLCAISEVGKGEDINNIYVIAGTDELAFAPGTPINEVIPETSCQVIQQALLSDANQFNQQDWAIVFKTHTQATSVVYLSGIESLNALDKQLLEMFCSKVAINFDNINYYDQLQYKNSHDLMTGLLNRSAFIEEVDQLKQQQPVSKLSNQAAGASQRPCLLVFGVDRFRDINNDLGYDIGDSFLQEIAGRLMIHLPAEAILARLGADEFAAYVGRGFGNDAAIYALRSKLTEPVLVQGEELIPSISIGFVHLSDFSRPCYDLLAETEDALLTAKHLGGNRCIEAKPLAQKHQPSRLALTRDLNYALKRDELALYYQPIIHGRDGQLAGFEALLRWHHPERGVVAPASFIEQIETTDLMLSIGDWVLDKSMSQAEKWNRFLDDRAKQDFSLSVNVSARQIMVSNLVSQLRSFIDSHAILPGRLRLEITESLIMEDIDQAEDILHTIKDLGVMLSLDDFGTGYSSMNYLNRLPFDTLKLDRSFINNMGNSEQSVSIINFVIKLAHELGIEVVAEGVESLQQHQILVELGCDFLQGYYFGHPMPEDNATGFIESYQPKTFP